MLKHLLPLAFLLLPFQSSIAQSSSITAKELFSRTQQKLSYDCELQKLVLEIDPSPKSVAALEPSIDLLCTCLPRAVELLQAKVNANSVSLYAAQEDLKIALLHCQTESIKKSMLELCRNDSPKGVKPENKESYCQCLHAGVNQLSDQEYGQSLQIASANIRAKVAARAAGQADPIPQPDVVESKVVTPCEAKYGDKSPDQGGAH